jgi:C-terminal processing protease CtpA/Prc
VKSNHHIEAVNEEPLFSGEIILLTDNYIFGVGEYLTRIADQSGFATLVGKPTRGKGVIGDMDVSVISLPKSGMVFTYQLKYDLWDDGTTLVKPISPDFLALDQETPLEASMRYIEENRSVIIRR